MSSTAAPNEPDTESGLVAEHHRPELAEIDRELPGPTTSGSGPYVEIDARKASGWKFRLLWRPAPAGPGDFLVQVDVNSRLRYFEANPDKLQEDFLHPLTCREVNPGEGFEIAEVGDERISAQPLISSEELDSWTI